jgi:pimeloyl-ACP methyl ester carboxylesterase
MTAYAASGARIVEPNIIRTCDGVNLFYRDWGEGQPVVFVAGWSLPSDQWNYQMLALLEQGSRVIAFDRRGHGRSSDPGRGYTLDTLADDLAAVLEALDLHEVTLVAHSMGCNEVVRYLSRHGSGRVDAAALLGTMTPDFRAAGELMEHFRREQLSRDFPLWIAENIDPFVPGVTPGMKDWLRGLALQTSAQALYECNRAIQHADMREEMRRIDIPVLLIAGTQDASAPFELTARPSAQLLPHARLRVYEGAAHGMFLTHMQRVNGDLIEFIKGRE